MACNSIALNGLCGSCSTSIGGIKAVYIALREDVTVALDVDGNKIKTVTMKGDAKFKKYTFRKQAGSLSSEATIDDANGSSYFTNSVDINFVKQETVKRVEIMALFLDETVVIVEDANGLYWYLGYDFPVTCSALSANTGTAFGDANQYTIQLQDMSMALPYEVDADAVAGAVEEGC